MNLETLRRNYKKQILAIAETCNAENIRLFGSVARGEERKDSDIDLLVHMKPGSGFCIGGLKWRLEELLHCEVDIVPDTSLHPIIKDKVLKEAVKL